MSSSIEYLNKGPKTKFLSLNSKIHFVYAVEEVANILEKLNVRTIIKVGSISSTFDE